MIYTIKDVCYCFIYTYVAIYVTYMYICYYQEKCIKENEEIYQRFTKTQFYYEIFYMVIKQMLYQHQEIYFFQDYQI